ncbi:uncharacterized protein LOC144859972 [Branchiostoma floridae x Branchiostoma japonicum]
MAGNPRQDLYLEISRNLLQEELRDLRNYVSGAKILPAGVVQNATAQEIFNQLEKEWNLKLGDLSLLADLLRKIGRNDYAKQAEKIAENQSQEELHPRYEPPWRLVRSEGSWLRKRRSENYEQGYARATSSGRQRASLEEIAYNRQNVKTEDDYEPVRKRPRQDPKKPRQDPFVLQIKRESIKKCQGCKQQFGNPIPPANLVIEHFDNYPYNRKGAVINSWRPGYFHANFGCIKPRYSDFDPYEVVVPPSTVENLTKPHMEYCRTYGILLSVDDKVPVTNKRPQNPKKSRQDPFMLQMKTEMVQKCQGCKQQFGNPIPPANLVIQHFDNYPYNKKGSDIDSWRNGYFHANFGCIKPRYSDFDRHEVVVPPSTLNELTDDHVEYCREHGILLSVPWET